MWRVAKKPVSRSAPNVHRCQSFWARETMTLPNKQNRNSHAVALNIAGLILAAIGLLGLVSIAEAQPSGINYPTRTTPYSGWSGIVKGDNNTIGMSGATVALPDSIAAMQFNPAGYAMDVGGLAAQINSFTNRDPNLDHGTPDYVDYQWGIGTSVPPWGFGLSYYSPTTEHSDTSEVSVREVRLSVARMVGQNLSIGVAFGFDKGIRKFSGADLSGTHVSGQIGALYKVKDHWILGASYTPALTIGPTSNALTDDVTSFNQNIETPNVIAIGLGFRPNRFFKAGFSLLGITPTPDTTLLYDQTVANGQQFTVEPRLGASYILGEWHFIKVELAVGTYYEQSRVQDIPNRTHGTFGLDVNPWFINTSLGVDTSRDYTDWVVTAGIDLVRTFRFFKIIPPDPVPFYEGAFPPIFKANNNGLPDGMTLGEPKAISPPSAKDVTKIVKSVPAKLDQKFGGTLPNAPPPETKIKKSLKAKLRHRKKKHVPAAKAVSPQPEH